MLTTPNNLLFLHLQQPSST